LYNGCEIVIEFRNTKLICEEQLIVTVNEERKVGFYQEESRRYFIYCLGMLDGIRVRRNMEFIFSKMCVLKESKFCGKFVMDKDRKVKYFYRYFFWF
jgi:hypothetical protein